MPIANIQLTKWVFDKLIEKQAYESMNGPFIL